MNYKKIANIYRKEALLALEEWIKIASPYEASSVAPGAPFGKGVKKSLEFFANLGKKNGFQVDMCDGYATELSIGDKGPLIGIYGHADVVPAGDKWKHAPYGGTYDNGAIYGRGATDDKGPMIAAFFFFFSLKDNGLIQNFRVKIVAGGDEERGSSCLRYYFQEHKGEKPKFGFTPDSDWPLIYGEKGMLGYNLTRICDLSPIVAMDGGSVPNAVCDSLLVTMTKNEKIEKSLKAQGIDADILSNDALTMIRFKGKAAHGSTPENGKNAAAIAFSFLGKECQNVWLEKLGSLIASSDGAFFGGAHTSAELGKATYNYGLVNYDGKRLSLSLDFRFGETCPAEECIQKLAEASKMNPVMVSEHSHLLFDKKSDLVKTLLSAYRSVSHDYFAKPLAIGGGTYAKEAPNTVAFGACFKGRDGNMHAPEEYILEKDLLLDMAIYMKAILSLGKKAQ